MTRYPHDVLAVLRRASVMVLLVIYVLGVAASLYFVSARRFAIDGSESVHLVPQGGLEIRTRPAGAVVRLNGESIGVTPVANPELEPGRVDLTMDLEGYVPWRGTVDVPNRQFVDTGKIPLVPLLPEREDVVVTPGTSYPVPGNRPIVVHVTASAHELVILERGGRVQNVPEVRVDWVAAHPASTSIAVFGRRESRRVVVVIGQRSIGLRVHEYPIDADAASADGVVPVRFSPANETFFAFTPDYGLSISDAGVERHELWSGRLVAWGAPEGDWSALTDDGYRLRYKLGVVHDAGNAGPLPAELAGSTIIAATDAIVMLRARNGTVTVLEPEGGRLLVANGVLDTTRAGEDILLSLGDSIAVAESDGTIRTRLEIAGAGLESFVGVTGTGLVVFETAGEIRGVPLAAVLEPELTLAPVSLVNLREGERAIGMWGTTLVYGSDRRIVWQSVEAPEDGARR